MNNRRIGILTLLGLSLLLVACALLPWSPGVAPTPVPPSPVPPSPIPPSPVPPTSQPPVATTSVPATPLTPATTAAPASPTIPPVAPPQAQRIEFKAEDGAQLVGDYYPAASDPAPLVILMHQMGSDRKVWVQKGLVDWLHSGVASSNSPVAWPALPQGTSFAVFAFDFRGHGESKGQSGEVADFLSDAKAAINTASALPGVDAQRIVLIGASIGADAAVDVCTDGCRGALSLSPGSFLGVPYTDVVAELALDNKPAWCLAAADDKPSTQTCLEAGGNTYRNYIYPGEAHGAELLVPGLDPDVGQVFLDFLKLAFGLG